MIILVTRIRHATGVMGLMLGNLVMVDVENFLDVGLVDLHEDDGAGEQSH